MAYTSAEGGYVAGASVFHFDATGADAIKIPDAELLFTGDFKRHGPDLILTGHDGRHHIVPGYFSGEKHPALVAPNGASLSAALVELLAGSPTPGQYAQAQPTPSDAIGKVEKVVGHAVVIRNGVQVALNVGDAVYKSDVIQTGSNSSCGIDFPDGTALNLVANTRMALNDYSYDANGNSNEAVFSLVQGTFAFVAGRVAHTGAGLKIDTPVATMGIRGTTGFVQEQIGTITANIGNVTYSFAVTEDQGTNQVGQYELIDANGNVIATVSQNGYVTYVTPQGPSLPPIVTTQPMSNSQLGFEQQIIQQVFQVLNSGNNANPQSNPGNNGSSTPPPLHNLQQLLQNNGSGGSSNTITVGTGSNSQSGTFKTSGTNTTAATPITTWIGPYGGDWNNPYYWKDGVVPLGPPNVLSPSNWETVDLDPNNVSTKVTLSAAGYAAGLIIEANAILNIANGGSLTVANGIDNSGSLQLNSSGLDPTLTINGTDYLTDGGFINLMGPTAQNLIVAAATGAKLVNVDNTIEGSGTIGQGDGALTLVNGADGLIEAKPLAAGDTGVLIINTGNLVDNSGGLAAAGGGTLQIKDIVKNESTGIIEALTGGKVLLTGATVDNFGQIGSTGGSVSLTGVAVTNESGGFIGTAANGALVSFTDSSVGNEGGIGTNGGAITFDDTPLTNNAQFASTGAPGINADNGGTITFQDNSTVTNNGLMAAQDGALIDFQGGQVDNTVGSATATTEGIIAYDGGSITFNGTQVTNTGLIGAMVGATGTGGTVNFDNAIVDNSGGFIAAENFGGAATSSSVNLSDSTLEGGTLFTSGPGSGGTGIYAVVSANGAGDPNMSVLDGATDGPLTVEGYVGIFQGAQLELTGTIHIDGAYGTIDVGGPSAGEKATPAANLVIDGTVAVDTDGANTSSASISLDGTASNPAAIIAATGGGTLDNVNTMIAGSGAIGAGNPLFLLVNEQDGIINAVGATPLTLDNDSPATGNFAPNAIINSGLMEANGGGGLTIENSTIDNSTFNPNTNTGVDGHIEADSLITLDGATILQGFVTIGPDGELTTTAGSANEIETANGPTHNTNVATIVNGGKIAITDDSSLTLASPDAIDNAGSVALNSTGHATTLYFDQPFAGINGGGKITLSNSTENFINVTQSGDQLTNFDNTISGAGTIGGGGMVLVNDGIIDATDTKPLVVDANGTLAAAPLQASVTNNNTLEATGGGTLVLSSPTIDNSNGSIIASGTGSVVQFSGTTITDGTITTSNGGGLEAKSGADEISGVNNFTNNQLTVDNGAILTLSSDILSGGTITIDAGGTLDLVSTEIIGATLDLVSGGILNVFGTSTIDTFKSVLSGTTTVEAGQTLVLQDELVIGSITDKGTVEVEGSTTIDGGSITESGAGSVQINLSQQLTVEGGAQIKGGPVTNLGTIIVAGAATFSQLTITNAGATIIVDDTDTLTLDGTTINGGVIDDYSSTVGGSILISTGASEIAGTSSAAADLNGNGTGTVTLDAGLTLSYVDLNGVTVETDPTALSVQTLTLAGPVDIAGPVTFDKLTVEGAGNTITNSGTLTIDDTVTLSGITISGGNIDNTGSITVITNSGITGNISGSGDVTVTSGTLTLSGDNGYSGVTTIDSGATLKLSSGGAIASSSDVADDGTFNIAGASGGVSIVGLSGDGTVTLGSNTLTLSDPSATTDSFSGAIGGTGGLTISAGTETLTASNGYSGVTTIDSGATLKLSSGGAIASSSDVADDGTFNIAGASGGVSIVGLSGDGTVTLGSNTLTLSDPSATTDSFSGAIGGTGGLTISAGTETLTASNGYSGVTTIDSGATLKLSSGGAIASSSDVADDGTFNIAGASGGVSIVGLSGDGTVTLGSNTLTLSDPSATTDSFSGAIGGTGGLTISAGTETLTASNGYSGVTTIDSGATLKLSSGGAIASSSDVADDGTFNIAGASGGVSIVGLSGDGTVTLGSNTLTLSDPSATTDSFSGAIGGTGGLTISAGTETLTASNGYSGVTTIDSGATLKLSSGGAIASSSDVADDGTFNIAGASGGVSIVGLSGDGTVTLGSNTLTLSDPSATTDSFSGAIGGTGGLTISAGTETLTASNGYSGVTTIDSGATLKLSSGGAIASSSDVADDGTFNIAGASGGVSIVGLSGDGTVTLGSNTLTLSDPSATTDSFSGAIGGTGGLTISAGTETLTASNGYSGVTTIDSGATLKLSSGGAIASSSDVADDGTFNIAGASGGVSIVGLSGDGTVTLGSNTLTLSDPSATTDSFSGAIGGTGGLTISAGTETLTASNGYSGVTTIDSGATLKLSSGGAIASSSDVADDGTFNIAGASGGVSIVGLSGDGTVTLGSNTLTLSDPSATTDSFSGAIGGTGGLTISAGTETLTASNGYSGVTTIDSGATLKLSSGGAIASSSDVADDGTFNIAGASGGVSIVGLSGDGTVTLGSNTLTLSDPSATTDSFSGAIGGTGGLTISAGTETLTASNGYSGVTTIDSGATLKLSSGGAIASSSDVADDGTFNIAGASGGVSIVGLSGDGTVTLGSNTLTLSDPSATTDSFSGAIGGTGGLTISAGTETLTASNGYSGVTTIDSGATLKLSSGGAIASSSDVADDGTFNIAGASGGVSIVGLSGDGTVTLGSNTLTLTDESGSFSGTFDNGEVAITGTLTITGDLVVDSTVTLSSGGVVSLGGAADEITGTSGTLDNYDTISGAGAIGDGTTDLTLNNEAGGTIDATGGTLTLDTGTNQITNAGTLEATSGGTLDIDSAVDNSGTGTAGIIADGGTVDVAGAVTNTGAASISNNGILEFQSSVANGQTVTFDNTTGTLQIDSAPSPAFAATIANFSASNIIDLTALTYSSGEQAVWTQDGSGGTLQIENSSSVVLDTLNLNGTYTTGNFVVQSDGATPTAGTEITWTTATETVGGVSTAVGFSNSATVAFDNGNWVVEQSGATVAQLTGSGGLGVDAVVIGNTTYDLVDPNGSFTSLQAAIDAAQNGNVILVAPGTYTESANYDPVTGGDDTTNGINPVGLLIDKSVTIEGVDASGNVIASASTSNPTIVSSIESDWGTNFYITAPNVTITGLNFEGTDLKYGQSPENQGVVNKVIEIVANNVTLADDYVGAFSGVPVASSVYIDELTVPSNLAGYVADISSYDVAHNVLTGDFVEASGVGYGDSTTNLQLTDNEFTLNAGTTLAEYFANDGGGNDVVILDGNLTSIGIGWDLASVVAPDVTGNTVEPGYTNAATDGALFLIWDSSSSSYLPDANYVADYVANNDLGQYAYALTSTGALDYSTYGGTTSYYFIYVDVTEATAPGAANPDDTIVVQSGTDSSIQTVGTDNLTIETQAGSSDINLLMGPGVTTITLADYDAVHGANVNVAGNSGADIIYANDGNDILAAGMGGAKFYVGGDNDTLIGSGDGSTDTAVFANPLSDYTVTLNNGTLIIVLNGTSVIDTATDIQNFQFDGTTYTVAQVAGATPGAQAPITWSNTAGGDWSDGSNWSNTTGPAAYDVAQATDTNTYTVTIASGSNENVDGLNFTNANATLNIAGSLTIWGADSSSVVAGQVENSGTFNIVNGTLNLNAGVTNDGNMVVAGGTLGIAGPVAGTGSMTIGDSANLELQSSATQTVTFTGATGELDLTPTAAFNGDIVGFTGTAANNAQSDEIVLSNFTSDPVSDTANYNAATGLTTLTVTDSQNLSRCRRGVGRN